MPIADHAGNAPMRLGIETSPPALDSYEQQHHQPGDHVDCVESGQREEDGAVQVWRSKGMGRIPPLQAHADEEQRAQHDGR